MKKALFLDRDGTLNYDIDYLHEPDKLCLIPGTAEAFARARALGYRFYLFTNQSGVGRGYFTLEDVHACNARLVEQVGMGGDLFDAVCIATERPDEPSHYRKPSPLFIQERIAADGLDPKACYMLGDRQSDWEAGLNAGINGVALRSGKELNDSAQASITAHHVPVFDSFADFVASLQG